MSKRRLDDERVDVDKNGAVDINHAMLVHPNGDVEIGKDLEVDGSTYINGNLEIYSPNTSIDSDNISFNGPTSIYNLKPIRTIFENIVNYSDYVRRKISPIPRGIYLLTIQSVENESYYSSVIFMLNEPFNYTLPEAGLAITVSGIYFDDAPEPTQTNIRITPYVINKDLYINVENLGDIGLTGENVLSLYLLTGL